MRGEVRQGADLEIETAVRWNDVQRRTALDHSDLHGRERRVEALVVQWRSGQGGADVPQPTDQARGLLDGIDPVRCVGRMTGGAAHVTPHRQFALVTEHRLEFGRLADQTQRWCRDALGQHFQQAAHAEATDLFVIGKRQMHRAL
ncbi:hypothetical protein D3C79_910160 [compost metagenome]